MATTTDSTPKPGDLPPPASAEPQPAAVEGGETTPKTIVTLDSNGEHQLQSPWTFWFARKSGKNNHPSPSNYAEHLQKIASFNTVESFYKTYVYMSRPVHLPKESIFHMFKGDSIPMWESFPNGGSWVIKVTKKGSLVSVLWEELIMLCIGETLEEPDIVGIVCNIRSKDYTLALWNSDSSNPALRARVAEKLKYFLRIDPTTQVEYKPNSAALRSEVKVSNRNGKSTGGKDKKKKKKGNKAAAAAPAQNAGANASTAAPATANASANAPQAAPAQTPATAPATNGTA